VRFGRTIAGQKIAPDPYLSPLALCRAYKQRSKSDSHSYAAIRTCMCLGGLKGNGPMTSKITLTVAAFAFALSSSMAVAGTANAAPSSTTVQAQQAYDWAAPAATDAPNAHRYHGGPKSND
jgi:hypothetical protein